MPRDAVSRTANVERNGGHKWVNVLQTILCGLGLQGKDESAVVKELQIDVGTLLARKESLLKKLYEALVSMIFHDHFSFNLVPK